MTYDFHARYALPTRDQMTQAYAVDYLTGYAKEPPEKLPELAEIEDPAARLEVLAQALASGYKDRARIGQLRGKPGGLWHWIASGKARAFLEKQRTDFLQPLGLLPTLPDMTVLPYGSWGMRFTFKLASPYISRDDTVWHILDNPLKKEWIFKLPYVSPSQWKGALRAAMVQKLANLNGSGKNDSANRDSFVAQRIRITRLFGNERGVQIDDEKCEEYLDEIGGNEQAIRYREHLKPFVSEKGSFSGCLHFYPTFFTELGLEVINPHPRDKGAGKQPIYFECVPAGATGDFVLLYVPFDRIGKDEKETRDQVVAELRLVAEGVKAMFRDYGFGAKTSSGFGTAEDRLVGEGNFTIKAELAGEDDVSVAASPPLKAAPNLARYLESQDRLIKDLRHEDGTLKSEAEYREFLSRQGKSYRKKDEQLYDKAKSWWEREGQKILEEKYQEVEADSTDAPDPQKTTSELLFRSLSELYEKVQNITITG